MTLLAYRYALDPTPGQDRALCGVSVIYGHSSATDAGTATEEGRNGPT